MLWTCVTHGLRTPFISDAAHLMLAACFTYDLRMFTLLLTCLLYYINLA